MRVRDPRWDPQAGDVLSDDPPLRPLVVESRDGDRVHASSAAWRGQTERQWEGALEDWRTEMREAEVMARGAG